MAQTQRISSYKVEKYPPKPAITPQQQQDFNKFFLSNQNRNEGIKKLSISRKSRHIQTISQEILSPTLHNEGIKPQNSSQLFDQQQLEGSSYINQKSEYPEVQGFQQQYNNVTLTKQQQILLQNPDNKQNLWQFYGIIKNLDKEIGVLKKENEKFKMENLLQADYQQKIENLNQEQIQLDQQNRQLEQENGNLKKQIKQKEAEIGNGKRKIQQLEVNLQKLTNAEFQNKQLKQEIISLKEKISSLQVKVENLDNQLKNQSKIFYESQEEFQNLLIQKLKETFPKLDINNISIRSDKALQDQLKSIVSQNEKTIDSNIEQIEQKMSQYLIEIKVQESNNEQHLETLNQINPQFENVINVVESLKKALDNLIKKNDKIGWNSTNKEQQKITYLQQHWGAFNNFSLIVKKVHNYLQFLIDQAQRFSQCKHIFLTFLNGQSLKQNQDQFESTAEKSKSDIIPKTDIQISKFNESLQSLSNGKNTQNLQKEQPAKLSQEVQTSLIVLQNQDKEVQTYGSAQVCGKHHHQNLVTQEITMVVKCQQCWLFGNRLAKAKEIHI